MAAIEEPVGTTSALAVNFVAEMMRPSVPVALCGQGADEPLGGYGRHRGARLASLAQRLPGARTLAARLPRPGRAVTLSRGLDALAAPDDLQLLMNAYRLVDDATKAQLYRPEFARRVREAGAPAQDAVERLRSQVAGRDPLGQMLFVDTRLWLPDELLTIADKMSMAASVELRVPFLDRDLVAVAESAHPSQHVHRLRGKSLHKQAMESLLPREVVHRRKLGWVTPVDRWLRGELHPLAEEVLLGEGELCSELLEPAPLRRMLDEHAGGSADHTRQLFSLLSLGLWHRGVVATPKDTVSRQPAPAG
jgi:asparagine synthase (glutamine-hydrolysing)